MIVGGHTVLCDRCGGDCGNGGVTECATVTVLNDQAEVETLHFCYRASNGRERCAARVLTAKATAAHGKHAEKPLAIYRPAED